MPIADKFKDLTKKAQDAAAGRQDKIRGAVQKAQQVADQKTGGKYSDQIQRAGAKAEGIVDNLKPADGGPTDTQQKPAGGAPAPAPTRKPAPVPAQPPTSAGEFSVGVTPPSSEQPPIAGETKPGATEQPQSAGEGKAASPKFRD